MGAYFWIFLTGLWTSFCNAAHPLLYGYSPLFTFCGSHLLTFFNSFGFFPSVAWRVCFLRLAPALGACFLVCFLCAELLVRVGMGQSKVISTATVLLWEVFCLSAWSAILGLLGYNSRTTATRFGSLYTASVLFPPFVRSRYHGRWVGFLVDTLSYFCALNCNRTHFETKRPFCP